jgi:4-amino-4-deoxy-L-arabinose transferase-like glycosyltransferase
MPAPTPAANLTLAAETRRLLHWSLIFLLLARVLCIVAVPLTDTTEARYAEIARKMVETNDWITLWHDYGVPFWAKPPLSTWLSALSMKVFGINEFGARLPSLLLAFGMLWLVWRWVEARRGRDYALLVTTALASMALFFAAAGAVMTDSSLAICTTLTMIAFWRALHGGGRVWGYAFFAGLGFGLLAKGPLVGVLTFLPIVPWVLIRRNWRAVWTALPWLSGTALMLAIALPWYLLAEHKTPGFLQYFIVGEHFKRFLDPGWNGDRYGHAHAEPIGMIWPYWVLTTFPWTPAAVIAWLLARRRKVRLLAGDDDSGWVLYLILWVAMPLLFFTMAHNIIWPYPFPTLPASAILAVEFYRRLDRGGQPLALAAGRTWAGLSAVAPVAFLILTGLYAMGLETLVKSSQKDVVRYYQAVRPSADSGLYFFHRRYYSGEFYSAGKSRIADTPADFAALLGNGRRDFLVIKPNDLAHLSADLRAHFEPVHRFGNYLLVTERATAAAP